jgi:hypothetical protein
MTKSETGPAAKVRKRKARQRRHRARPTPRWLLKREDLDEVAKRRCLMVLQVLSGAKPVTEVIGEMKLSRGTYYQLEERAMRGMLRALSPTAGPDGTETAALDEALARVKELEAKVGRMEQEKRRTDRLVYVMERLVKPGPVVTEGRGRPRKRRGHSTSNTSTGTASSPGSTRPPTSTSVGAAVASPPTPAGADAR